MPTKGNKGGKPHVLLGRSFLKTARFKLIYYDEIFTFKVGNAIEIFHLPPPLKPQKKGLHQLQHDKGKMIKDKPWKEAKGRTRKEKTPMIKPNHFKEKHKKGKMEDNKGSDQKKKKKKTGRSDEEVPEYIPEGGPAENQDPGEEEPEGPGADHEMDPNPDPEELEEDPEEDPEMGEEEVEAVEPSDNEYNAYFTNYFELAPPPSPDSSDESLSPTDD
ncbi:hypothetical protein PIB30_056269 [Stylosanthes scabra]|uniref:Uncharacterized protein n=1 Tax=Stylosanthes scabra TaxID=79078 RepID=A0ABU6SJA6_9FABA|nr:hypothetical protein [Stylosanthes scabra]